MTGTQNTRLPETPAEFRASAALDSKVEDVRKPEELEIGTHAFTAPNTENGFSPGRRPGVPFRCDGRYVDDRGSGTGG